jgi:hypothetical protein
MRVFQIAIGLVIILFGALLLMMTSGLLALTMVDIAGIALILSGLLFWVPGVVWRQQAPGLTALFIPGALAFAVGTLLMYTSRAGWSEWAYLWTVLLVALGVAFLAMYYLGVRARGLWLAGVIVGGVGALLLAFSLAIFGTATAERAFGAIILIALGLVFVARALVRR